MKNIQSVLFIILIIILVLSLVLFSSSNQKQLNVDKIYKNIRCLVCQSQSIDESNSDFSESFKLVIDNKIKNGATEKEIYEFLKDKYGEWIVFKPSFALKNLFLWIFPYFIFIAGGILIFFVIKKNKPQ